MRRQVRLDPLEGVVLGCERRIEIVQKLRLRIEGRVGLMSTARQYRRGAEHRLDRRIGGLGRGSRPRGVKLEPVPKAGQQPRVLLIPNTDAVRQDLDRPAHVGLEGGARRPRGARSFLNCGVARRG